MICCSTSEGRVELTDPSGRVQVGQASAEQLEALRALLTSPELAQSDASYETDGADLLSYEITLVSGGDARTITTMDAAGHPEVVGRLLVEVSRMRPATP
jgi:hypothetical protein